MKPIIIFVIVFSTILSTKAQIPNALSRSQIPNTLTRADKVYGLSKFWQEVNYNFVYLNKIDKDKWDSAYRALITSVQETENDYQYYRELQKFCAMLKDGHTGVFFPQKIELMNDMFGDYRLFIWHFNDKVTIVGTNLSKKDEIPIGSEVIEVNGKPTDEYINENVAPYISSSTDYILKDWSINRLFEGLEGETYQVKIKKPQGEIISLSLTHKRTEEKEIYPVRNFQKDLFDFKWYNKQIAYIGLNSFSDPKIDSLFVEKLPELYKAKGLIIDLRYNGGGDTNIGTAILKYLTNDTILYGAKEKSRLHIPAYKAWGKYVNPKDTLKNEWAKKSLLSFQDKYFHEFDYHPDRIKLKAERIVVPTVILIGHNTGSAAEDFLICADNQKHMIKIGENSFGSTGQPLMFELPGGGSARICTKQDTYPDGREFVGYGVKPDIEVKSTFTDYLLETDPALDKALEYLISKIE